MTSYLLIAALAMAVGFTVGCKTATGGGGVSATVQSVVAQLLPVVADLGVAAGQQWLQAQTGLSPAESAAINAALLATADTLTSTVTAAVTPSSSPGTAPASKEVTRAATRAVWLSPATQTAMLADIHRRLTPDPRK